MEMFDATERVHCSHSTRHLLHYNNFNANQTGVFQWIFSPNYLFNQRGISTGFYVFSRQNRLIDFPRIQLESFNKEHENNFKKLRQDIIVCQIPLIQFSVIKILKCS